MTKNVERQGQREENDQVRKLDIKFNSDKSRNSKAVQPPSRSEPDRSTIVTLSAMSLPAQAPKLFSRVTLPLLYAYAFKNCPDEYTFDFAKQAALRNRESLPTALAARFVGTEPLVTTNVLGVVKIVDVPDSTGRWVGFLGRWFLLD